MNNLLFGISLSALLSSMSLFIVLLRVSPLLAPVQAVPAFFLSLILSVGTVGTLAFYLFWKYVPIPHHWDAGKMLSISLRQGVFLGIAVSLIFGFLLLHLLTWWIAAMIICFFVLVEMAMAH